MKTYETTKGMVVGNFWGGGTGGYPAESLTGFNSKKELRIEIERGIKEGWLDSGMGFDGLKGAVMEIRMVETIKIKGKNFTRYKSVIEFFGLEDEDEDEMLEMFYNYF